MQKFVKLSPLERKNLIQKAVSDLNLRFDIVEKDIWVCYVLNKLFSHKKLQDVLIFKGGTCLSKVYDAINRFSEDVDITINSKILDIDGSSQKLDKIKSRTKAAARKFVAEEIVPILTNDFNSDLLDGCELSFDEADKNNVTLLFSFPSMSGSALGNVYSYIKPKIKLEFGALGGVWPVRRKVISPYAKKILPGYFDEFEVNALDIKRNFIEKLLILHSICFRPDEKPINYNYSRHYYDVYSIIKSGLCVNLQDDLEILQSAVSNKNNFWNESWVDYANIRKFSHIKLIPADKRIAEIKKDYKNMEEMFFGYFPSFDDLLAVLMEFERVNCQPS
jgi:hypothetical protein